MRYLDASIEYFSIPQTEKQEKLLTVWCWQLEGLGVKELKVVFVVQMAKTKTLQSTILC